MASQRVTYTGLTLDTFLRTISIPHDKKLKLAAFLESFFGRRSASISDLASLRGRIQHYSICLPFTLPFAAFISSVMGCEDIPDYNLVVPVPPLLSEIAVFLRGVLERHCDSGVPLWPFVASTLHDAFLAGETGQARIVVITWDASLHGWGAVVRWWANPQGKVIVGSLPDTPDMQHQVRREAMAGVLSYEATARILDVADASVILRNDAVAALAALRKGSFKSSFLQQCSMRLARAMAIPRSSPHFLHAPGRVLIDEGVDDLSRDFAIQVSGPVSNAYLRDLAASLLASCGWSLTIDAFASTDNAIMPRFFARFAEPAAEFEDAFGVPDWGVSRCPHCHQHHREVLFAYPPDHVINRFIAKAAADGVRALVVVPLAVTAPFWHKLLRSSVVANGAGYVRYRSVQSAAPATAASMDLALFAVDFAPVQLRSRPYTTTPDCGHAAAFRGRPPAGSPHDQEERARIHAALQDLRTDLRS